MASHRKVIREKMVELLIGAIGSHPTIALQRVFPARILPIQSLEELPCLLVYTSDEKSVPTGDSQYLERTCTLAIEGAVSGDEDEVDDLLDDLADQVEAIVDSNPRLTALLSKDLILKSTAMETGKEGESVVAGFRLEYDAVYMTARVEQDSFLTAPTQVWVDPHTDPTPYEDILGVTPKPTPQAETACGPDGCAIPAWKGELGE